MKLSQEGKNAKKTREFIEGLWNARLEKKRTYQEISDETLIPYHTVCRFFQGTIEDPGIYLVNELCHALDVPLFAADQPGPSAEVAQLKAELQHKNELLSEKDKAIDRLMDRSRIMESGIQSRETQLAEKEQDLRTAQDGSKPLIYGLLSLCAMLAAVLFVYLYMDASDPYRGLIRIGEGKISIVIWLGIAGVIASLLVIVNVIANRRHTKHEKGDNT